MEEKIRETVKVLKRSYAAFWMIPLCVVILGETDLIPIGGLADDVRGRYLLETVCILIAAISIPLSLKLFSLVLVKKIDTYTFPVALLRYTQWSLVRMGILQLSVLFGLVSYYLILSSTGVLCALITLIASFFCLPSEKKLREELRIFREETDKEL